MKKGFIAIVSVVICISFILCFSMATRTAGANNRGEDAVKAAIWDGSIATSYAGGNGSAANPYGAQLAYLAKMVNAGTSYEGKYLRMTCDIYLNNTANWEQWETNPPANTWTAIGYNDWTNSSNGHQRPFSGNFDGSGFAVFGVYINKTGTTSLDSYQGLFGYCHTDSSSVNIVVANVGVEASYIHGHDGVGGVVGSNYKYGGTATISNCYNTGTVSGTGDYVGGVVGNNSYGSSINNSCNTGSVSGTGDYVGGVVGSSESTISNCYNTGTVRGDWQVGGVTGYTGEDASIQSCHNKGTVRGKSEVGGITGLIEHDYAYTDEVLVNCYNTGDIYGSDCIGGVVGKVDLFYYDEEPEYGCKAESMIDALENVRDEESVYAIIKNCYNLGSVNGEKEVGGIAGCSLSGKLNACCNTGEISGTGDYVGGVVGSSESTISNCYNTGVVSGTGDYVGGVAGHNSSGTISNCYNTGVVSGTDNYAGGITGSNVATGYFENSQVICCYNIGHIYCNGSYVGAICGYNYSEEEDCTAIVENCYYLYSCGASAGVNNGGGSGTEAVENVVPLSDGLLREQDSYAGFDFDAVWTMDGNADYPYAELQENPHQELETESEKPGDTDCNGSVNAADAAAILRYLVGIVDLSNQSLLNADCDGIAGVNAGDASAILRYLVGLLDKLR